MAHTYTLPGATQHLAKAFQGTQSNGVKLGDVNEKGEVQFQSNGHSIITKDSDGNSVPLDIMFAPKALRNFFNINSSVLKNSDNSTPLKERIGKDFAEVVFRRTGAHAELIDTVDLYKMNSSDITHADVDKFTVSANVSKTLKPISLSTIDFSQMNAAASLSQLIVERMNMGLISYYIQRAHYTIDKGAIDAGKREEKALSNWDPDEFYQAILNKAYEIERLVSKYAIGIPEEKIVIEMSKPAKKLITRAKEFGDQRNAGANAYDTKTGKLRGMDGYKVEVDSTMPEGVYARVRIPETLKALFVLEKATTGNHPITHDPFMYISFREGMTADMFDAMFIWTEPGYTPVNPKDAQSTPHWNDQAPQTSQTPLLVDQVVNNAVNIQNNATDILANTANIADHETRITALEGAPRIEIDAMSDYIGFEIREDSTVGDFYVALGRAKAKMSMPEIIAMNTALKRQIGDKVKLAGKEVKISKKAEKQETIAQAEQKAEEAKEEAIDKAQQKQIKKNNNKLFEEIRAEFKEKGLYANLPKKEFNAKVWQEVNKFNS